jgi:hypothetical protein
LSCLERERERALPRKESKKRRRMLEGKARVEDTDMPARMQAAATSAASHALDLFDVAGHIKTARLSSLSLFSPSIYAAELNLVLIWLGSAALN